MAPVHAGTEPKSISPNSSVKESMPLQSGRPINWYIFAKLWEILNPDDVIK